MRKNYSSFYPKAPPLSLNRKHSKTTFVSKKIPIFNIYIQIITPNTAAIRPFPLAIAVKK